MATPSTLNAVIARVAAGLYDMQLGYATMDWAVTAVTSNPAYGGNLSSLVQALYATDIQNNTKAAELLVVNLVELQVPTLDATLKTDLVAYVKGVLDAGGAGNEGATIIAIVNGFANLTSHPDATIMAAVTSYNAQITAALAYAAPGGAGGAPDVIVHPPFVQTTFFTIVPETAAGADVMHLTGNQDVRIDFTNKDHQIRGLDIDGDGLIEANGTENNPTFLEANVTMIADHHAGFEIVDAYSRNPLNHTDVANNFLGDIAFDGTGYKGDGVSTNGNIFLGGLGVDTAFTGDGNDFLAGGKIAQGRTGMDTLRGGRNADFFFAEFSGIDATDGGPTLFIDGGNTSDSTSAGDHGPQDSDWLLFEASDDDEPVRVSLDEVAGTATPGADAVVTSRSGETMDTDDVENFDASGNLYGFLDNVDVEIGGRAIDDRDASNADVGYNYGLGSTAQLDITGSGVGNIIIAGYDNDKVSGGDGNDVLFGGNLKFLNNPNSVGIVNDGRDELRGDGGNDGIVFEADGGVIDGGAGTDTLWVTNYALGLQTATDLLTDGVLRFDLKSQNIDLANGYGGANVGSFDLVANDTQDQSNYKGSTRVTMSNMESVIATGLGAVDYAAAGANNPELLFTNQQNQARYNGAMDLRGTEGTAGTASNTLYASGGADILEGRSGDDKLSGGDGNDDFYFGTSDAGTAIGDHVDVIQRQTDANGDNLWDGFDATKGTGGLLERDFNIGGTSSTGASVLKVAVQKAGGNTAGTELNQVVNFVSEIVTGVKDGAAFVPITLNTTAIKAATTYQGLTDAINAALDATAYGADLQATLQADGFTIFIADALGRELADSSLEVTGAGVSVNQIANTATQNTFEYGAPAVAVTKDRLIYKSYEDRLDNEGTDDDSVLGSIISLGIDSYAEDLVINFADEDADGLATTRLAEDQIYNVDFLNLTTQDKVTIDVNGVKYSLQVGVDLDGNIIAAEDGVGDTQIGIQNAFLTRYNAFINSFMDDDTSAGEVGSTVRTNATAIDRNGDGDFVDAFEAIGSFNVGLALNQVDYNGEETVFMVKPVVTLSNLSGGEPASVTVTNVSEHEVELLDFDGRNGELNETNVLFWGQEAINRATLETAKTVGSTITGKEAIVIDVGPNNLQDVVFNTTTAIPNNTATNDPLKAIPNGWSVHGDDFLLGGDGLDTISGGTGDDRVEGSIGGNGTTTWDTLDGGKNFYAIQVLGEPQARVYILNKWEAANPTKVTALTGLVISSITLIDQNETGTGVSSGVFDDTLQFSQKLFTPGVTRFTVTLDNFTLTGGVVELRNDGAGTVGVDTDGNGTIDNWTRFTNFENIRTVSGTSNAVAGDGQGNDTLNVTALSSATTGANGILYNLTNNVLGGAGGDPGSVMYSADAHASLTRPAATDFESLVIKVDGVESVIGGTGDDLLLIDETEAAKNNTFTGDLGDDRIEYQNNYLATDEALAEPTITIKVDTVPASLGGTDTVTSTAGRVGTTVATDTLNGVEFITLAGFTAAGSREDDVLDVTSMTAGAIVNYVDGTVRALDGTLHVTVENLYQIENIWADGNDTVIVADSDVMGLNSREDSGEVPPTPAANITLATFLDFDTLKNPGTDNTRLPFVQQDARQIGAAGVADAGDARFSDDIEVVLNQNEFKFNLSKTGTGADSDTVDYSNATDAIAVVVELDATRPNQYVLVDADGGTFDGPNGHANADDRIDQLVSVERIAASQGESVLDLSASTKGLEIKWSAFDVANQTASLDRDTFSVRISDLSTASPLQRTYIEYRDAGLSGTTTQVKATWSRLEGSDNAEVVIMNSAHSVDNNTFNLRGGANQMKYNELTRSITTTLSVLDYVAADVDGVDNILGTADDTGLITATTTFQDGNGAALPGSGTHVTTAYTANNGIATGSLRIAASQDAEDTLAIAGLGSKVFLLSESGTTDNQITVKLGSGTAQNSVVLTGYEFLTDAATDDVYDMGTLNQTLQGLTLTDNAADHDTIKVGNDAVGFNTGVANQIALDWIGSSADGADADLATGFNFDFDVLDITKVTVSNLNLVGGEVAAPVDADLDTTDEVVLGALSKVISITGFASLVLTQDSVAAGTSFTFNPASGTLVQGSTTVTTAAAGVLSFGGLTQETGLRNGTVADVSSAVQVTVGGATGAAVHGGAGGDTITGGGGADSLRGNGGADTLDGGTAAEVRTVQLDGITDADAGDSVTLTFDADGAGAGTFAVVVTAGVEYAAGAGSDAVGAALATKITTNLAALNAAVSAADAAWNNGASLVSASFNAASDLLTFTFSNGVDVTGTITTATTEGGTFAISTESTTTAGSDGGIDTFVFSDTAANNGADIINNFVAVNGASDDLLNFTAFLGGAATPDAVPTDFAAAGKDLLAGENVGVVFNKASLAAGDIALATGANVAGKIGLVNNGKAVVLVTSDVDGATDATANAYLVYYVQDTDTGAGQSFSVTLVGTLNSSTELNAADLFTGTDAFV